MTDIYLIILDTLRLDYSNDFRYLTSNLEFISLDNAIAPAPWTVPSHASIFTGVYPMYHGAHETKKVKIPEVRLKYTPLLTHKLSELGFRNYLLSANIFITPSFGFTGFSNVYFYTPYSPVSLKNKYAFMPLLIKKPLQKSLNLFKLLYAHFRDNWPLDKGITEITNHLRSIVSLDSPSRKFVFINLMEVHEPYYLFDDLSVLEKTVLGESIDMAVYDKWKRGYAKESKYLSENLRTILELIPEDALVIVTSDHGQLLGEHGLLGHGNFLFDELIRVPLYIRYKNLDDFDMFKGDNKWISLVSLYRLILNYVKTGTLDLSLLYSKFAISETYGIAGRINSKAEVHRQRLNTLEQHRIAFFYDSYKIIFNVETDNIEEIFEVTKNKKVDLDTFDELPQIRRYIKRFLNLTPSRIRTKLGIFRNKAS